MPAADNAIGALQVPFEKVELMIVVPFDQIAVTTPLPSIAISGSIPAWPLGVRVTALVQEPLIFTEASTAKLKPTCRAQIAAIAPESFTATAGDSELIADLERANGRDQGGAAEVNATVDNKIAAAKSRVGRLLLAKRVRAEL
jgi:hypothetical protein